MPQALPCGNNRDGRTSYHSIESFFLATYGRRALHCGSAGTIPGLIEIGPVINVKDRVPGQALASGNIRSLLQPATA